MSAQPQKTFIYEITLLEQFKHPSQWGDREKNIQREHLSYLDSLTKSGALQMAGIMDQGLEEHTGFIILTTTNYQEAHNITQADPSVREGMMTAKLRPVNIYFKP